MAYPQMASVPEKLSFAKIAAMPAPRMARKSNSQKEINSPPNSLHQVQLPASPPRDGSSTKILPNIPSPTMIENISTTIQGLSLVQDQSAAMQTSRGGESGESAEEDQSQLSTSSLNKPQSFDTKSMASVTTFAMDDKESIRPDDSASVRAADDDVPHIGLSRNSSFQHDTDSGANPSKSSLPISANVTIAGRRYPTMTNPPRFGTLPISPVIEARDKNNQRSGAPPVMQVDEPRQSTPVLNVAPDESLLEALASSNPSNRLMLLQLEDRLLSFLNDGAGEILELPPQNAFARMLTHKLADYYCLAHHINEDNSSVRIFKTGPRPLPTSLADLARSIPSGATQLPSTTTVKIMRRAQMNARPLSGGNSTAPSSSAPSKTTSENGAETNSDEGLMSPMDGTPGRDRSKLTREEREAQYKAARDRIFGDFQESVPSETASTGENSASMSRSSSSSGKKKTRKHKQPKDDSFEARSAFVQSYSQMSTQFSPSYSEGFPGLIQGPAGGFPQNNYGGTPTQGYVPFDNSMPFSPQPAYGGGNIQPYGAPDWVNIQNNQGGYFPFHQSPQFSQQAHMMPQMTGQFLQQPQPNMQQTQGWMMDQFQSFPTSPQGIPNVQWQGYAQPPTNLRSPGPASQYNPGLAQAYGNTAPAPMNMANGPFVNNKSLFNPQTRSFVPSYTANRSGGRNSRKKINSKNLGGSGSATPLTASSASSPLPKEDSLQQKYGTPASLPKKPPPSEINPANDGPPTSSSGALGTSSVVGNGPLVVNGTNNTPA